MRVWTGAFNGGVLYWCFHSPAAAVLAGYWLLLFLCGTDLQAPEAWKRFKGIKKLNLYVILRFHSSSSTECVFEHTSAPSPASCRCLVSPVAPSERTPSRRVPLASPRTASSLAPDGPAPGRWSGTRGFCPWWCGSLKSAHRNIEIQMVKNTYFFLGWVALPLLFQQIQSNGTPHIPDRRTMGEVTLFPLTYVSASSHGSRTTHPVQHYIKQSIHITMEIINCLNVHRSKIQIFKVQGRQPLPSPWRPVVLLKVQCSSLIKWPLRTMSWRVLAFSRPTLCERQGNTLETNSQTQHSTSSLKTRF